MAALLEIVGHIVMIWTLKEHLYHYAYFLLAETYHISPQIIF